MPKPTLSQAEWNVDGTNETAPTAQHKSDGWGLAGGGRTASSGIMNYWKRRVYLWLAWLDGLFSTDGSLTIPANEHVTVSGTGKFKRGTLKRTVPLAAGSFRVGGSGYQAIAGSTSKWNPMLSALNDEFHLPIATSQEETLTSIEFEQSCPVGSTVSYYLMKVELSGGIQTETAVQTLNATSATAATVSWTGMTQATDPAKYTQFFVVAKQTNGGALNSGILSGVVVGTTVA